jgi:hypothetical protein
MRLFQLFVAIVSISLLAAAPGSADQTKQSVIDAPDQPLGG